MNRWKTEPTVTLRHMYAHNQYSRWHDYVLKAAGQLGLLIGFCERSNWNDGSPERIWYTSAAMLERVGGLEAVHDRAHSLQQEDYQPDTDTGSLYMRSDAAW